MTCELIGKKLGHSFSKEIHEALDAYHYNLRPLPDEAAVAEYLRRRRFSGCNVTIPYKQTVIPLCDAVDTRAARIGAVNTIVNRNGLLTGYNTDYDGLGWMLQRAGIQLEGRVVLLLGSGGTSHTAAALARDAGAAKIYIASRSAGTQPDTIDYAQAARQQDVQVIINTSPVGMHPDTGRRLVEPAAYPCLEAVADVIYNPLRSSLVLAAQQLGLAATGGLAMLVGQALAAARLFTGFNYGDDVAAGLLRTTRTNSTNLVLIGMPSSGKTSLGKSVAAQLGLPFADMDKRLQQKTGRSPADIITQDGEEAFRRIETEILQQETAHTGRVISTGGGVVTQPDNLPLLRQNGFVVFLDRPQSQLAVGGARPLSSSPEALGRMYAQRLTLYKAAADATVLNDAPPEQVVRRIVEVYNEVLDS